MLSRSMLTLIAVVLTFAVCPVALAQSGAFSEEACPTLPPKGCDCWSFIGYGRGNEAEALKKARDDALAGVEHRLCAGLSNARCDGIIAAVLDWKSGEYHRGSRSACRVVTVRKDAVEQLERDEREFDQGIVDLAADLAGRGLERVWHAAPVWSNGCSADIAGQYIKESLDGELSMQGVRFDLGRTASPGASRLQLSLTPAPHGVLVTGLLFEPDQEGAIKVTGPRFPLDLFGVEETPPEACATDHSLGLRDGPRVGADGLRVWIDLAAGRNVFCEGDEIAPAVRVNRPARVQVYSVQRDGTAHLVWPGSGDGRMVDETPLDPGVVLLDEAAGDESLVAVAIPLDHSWGRTEGWSGYCKASDEFEPSTFYPAGAAVYRATFAVRPSGDGCVEVDVSAYRSAFFEAAPCSR